MLRLCVAIVVVTALPASANDIVYLTGHVKMSDGSAPGRSVEIKLDCKGADHAVRQTVTDKKGLYHLRVERDEFDHVARALLASATDVGTPGGEVGACKVVAALAGYQSTSYDLGTLKIGKDLGVPELVLTPVQERK
jgi:hypothetical protein